MTLMTSTGSAFAKLYVCNNNKLVFIKLEYQLYLDIVTFYGGDEQRAWSPWNIAA